jgi:ferritin-like protein
MTLPVSYVILQLVFVTSCASVLRDEPDPESANEHAPVAPALGLSDGLAILQNLHPLPRNLVLRYLAPNDLMNVLKESPPDVAAELCSDCDTTALNDVFRTAMRRNEAVLVALLLNDMRVDPTADDSNDAIGMASENGHATLVELLLKDTRADPTANDNYAIRLASQNGHDAVVKLLLKDTRAEPTANNNYAIQMASKYGHAAVVKLLLKDTRAEPTANYNYAIRLASLNGDDAVVELLLKDTRADPTAYDNYAIHVAFKCGHAAVVKLLLKDTRADPTALDNNAIRLASLNGHDAVVELLRAWSSKKENDKEHETANVTGQTLTQAPAILPQSLFLTGRTCSLVVLIGTMIMMFHLARSDA